MPYTIEKYNGDYRVLNSQTGKVHAKHTTKAKAEAQVRLLHSIEDGKDHIKKLQHHVRQATLASK